MIRRIGLVLLVLGLCACAANEQEKRYAMQGVVKALDSSAKTATIDAGQIGDWMAPMTMEYPVKPDPEFKKLHLGDKIDATVVVNGDKYYVTAVKVAPKK